MSELNGEDYVGSHEIHVTVAAETTDPAHFKEASEQLGVKAHVIYNEFPNGDTIVDYLTGSEIHDSTERAFSEMGRVATGLRESGLNVVREKIETTPWHPDSPKTSLDRLAPGQYFECHLTLPDLETIHGFRVLKWGDVPFLISTTDNKREAGLLFATMRHYIATAGTFCQDVEDIRAALAAQLTTVSMPTVEFAIYDSNPDHDNEWVNAYRAS